MPDDPRFLVVGPNGLREEFRTMLTGLTHAPQTSYASEFQRAIEEARAKQPELLGVSLQDDEILLEAHEDAVVPETG